jgi:hypothetical protein
MPESQGGYSLRAGRQEEDTLSIPVVEEVVVKDVQDRTETVHDAVRRTGVQVEQLGAERGQSTHGFEAYDTEFRKNFTGTYGSRGRDNTYEKYMPAYRYGYDLTSDKRYSGKDWRAFESEACRDWETRHPGQGTWETSKVPYAMPAIPCVDIRRVQSRSSTHIVWGARAERCVAPRHSKVKIFIPMPTERYYNTVNTRAVPPLPSAPLRSLAAVERVEERSMALTPAGPRVRWDPSRCRQLRARPPA